jgi:peptide/nickel transport system permease protein
MEYLLRRLAHGLLVLAGVSVLSFVFMALAPGDPLEEMRLNPEISGQMVAALRTRYGLDQPLPLRYAHWLQSVLRGELGFSFAYNAPVGALLWPRVLNTLLLTLPATIAAWLIAVPLGTWSASQRGRWGDRVVAGATTGLLIVPEVLLGLGLLLVAVKTGYFPVGGMRSEDFATLGLRDRMLDLAHHLVLPATALMLVNLPVLVRHVRAGVVEVLGTRYILAARARGVPPRRLLFRDALRPAANPLIALLGLSIAGLLSTSLIVEALMGWPGLGPLLLEAIAARDFHLVIGAVMCSTLLLLVGNLISDVLLYMADPRTRAEQ